MKVIKRDGREVEFSKEKIEHAIEKANNSIETKSKRIGKVEFGRKIALNKLKKRAL